MNHTSIFEDPESLNEIHDNIKRIREETRKSITGEDAPREKGTEGAEAEATCGACGQPYSKCFCCD